MARKSTKKSVHSPAEATLALIASKWTILIIEELMRGTKRFGELEHILSGISPRTLSLRLASLEKAGVIARKVFPEVPPRVEYNLTPLGSSLEKVVNEIRAWGMAFEKES